MDDRTPVKVALIGNPNVGKSTLFNHLTGMRQHTGNWPGKTVDVAVGTHVALGREFVITDLPGCYSLEPHSAEEEVTRDHLISGDADVAVVVCDASLLERNLILALEVIHICPKTVVVLNLMDEARRRGITVDTRLLEERLGVPVVCTSARSGAGTETLPEAILNTISADVVKKPYNVADTCSYVALAEDICHDVLHKSGGDSLKPDSFDRHLDRILTGRITGIPLMLVLLAGIMWLTVEGANYPSSALSELFARLGEHIRYGLEWAGLPKVVISCLIDGVYLVTTWVVSVMLPPMAIFFPLFTLLEDLGYLPRVAFNLDRFFKGSGSCGKQALTMCMGLGCNAAGVTGCRIIDSERERRIAILTNSMMPCNGRFPGIICLSAIFFAASGIGTALCLTLVIILGVGMTLITSFLLSKTVLKGTPSSFTLELPPYRIPKIGSVIVRSVLDRTLFVLGRAVSVAVPAGFVIWLISNVRVGEYTVLSVMTEFLDPMGRFLGMDGVIITAFVLALPANEIVLPLAAMGYMASGILADMGTAEMGVILKAAEWDGWTAAAVIAFSLFHWPCSTTLLTVKKETGSMKMMLLAAVLPTVCGVVVCLGIRMVRYLFFVVTF